MVSTQELRSNQDTVQDAARLQQKSRESIIRMARQINQTTELGAETIAELVQQEGTVGSIKSNTSRLHDSLDRSAKQLNKFDRWKFNITGRKKRVATRQAKQELKTERTMEATLAKAKRDGSNEEFVQQGNQSRGKMQQHCSFQDAVAHPIPIKKLRHQMPGSPGYRTSLNTESLDASTTHDLACIEETDAELDELLDSLGMQLDKLTLTSSHIGEEVQKSGKQIGKVSSSLENARTKQAVVSKRLQRNLVD